MLADGKENTPNTPEQQNLWREQSAFMLQNDSLPAADDVDMVTQLHSNFTKRTLSYFFEVAEGYQQTKTRLTAIEVIFGI